MGRVGRQRHQADVAARDFLARGRAEQRGDLRGGTDDDIVRIRDDDGAAGNLQWNIVESQRDSLRATAPHFSP